MPVCTGWLGKLPGVKGLGTEHRGPPKAIGGRYADKSGLLRRHTSAQIFLSGWFAGTRASGAIYENSPP
jgi:hypothetical protein